MTEEHEQNKHEPIDYMIDITNQLNSTTLDVDQQRTEAAPTNPHVSNDNLLSYVTQLATAKKGPVTFWSLPREIRDMIWSEVLGSEDDILEANFRSSVVDATGSKRGPLGPSDIYRPDRASTDSGSWVPRDDGRWDFTEHASFLLSSRPPLPLAHLCGESRTWALRKYNDAYHKKINGRDVYNRINGWGVNQEKSERFRWLSRHVAHLLGFCKETGRVLDCEVEVPLGEHEKLILIPDEPDRGHNDVRL